MTSKFAAKLGLTTQPTVIKEQKIDGFTQKMYNMVIVGFSILDKSSKIRFFVETFLRADTNIEVVSKMLFLTLNNVNIQFNTESLTWKSYTIAKALFTAKQVELINKYKFAKAVLDKNSKTFVMCIVTFDTPKLAMPILFSRAGQVVENNST